jgi:hypothetical protein
VWREPQQGLFPEGDGKPHTTTVRADNAGEDVARARPGARHQTGGDSQALGLPQVLDWITIVLAPQAKASLQGLQDRTNLSKTDITNRAITLYEFIDAQVSEGREFLVRDKSSGEIRRVLIV